jgi:flagellar basal-body rod protein FlgC
MFDAIRVINSGMQLHQTWMDAISDNIANINTVRPSGQSAFQARYVVAQEAADGNGAQVGGVAFGSAQGILTYDPENPLADSKGYVRRPDIDLGGQMAQMMMAQRAYQANLAVVDRARDAYLQALNITGR